MYWKFVVCEPPPLKVLKVVHEPEAVLYWNWRFSPESGVSPQPDRPSWTQAWNGMFTPPAKLTVGDVPYVDPA